ncbi:MAG TPA: hypothetical protein V6C86_15170 [Oculatellaceae cyanobacterium]
MFLFDVRKTVMAQPLEVLEVLADVLRNLGYSKVNLHRNLLWLNAELTGKEKNSLDEVFVVVVTCVPYGRNTEFLFSIQTNKERDSAEQQGNLILDQFAVRQPGS